MFELSYFLGKKYFGDHGFQNIFVYQSTLDPLELRKHKGTDYVLSWKPKGVYTFKLKSLYTAFLDSIKLAGYKMGINFDKGPLAFTLFMISIIGQTIL